MLQVYIYSNLITIKIYRHIHTYTSIQRVLDKIQLNNLRNEVLITEKMDITMNERAKECQLSS